MTDHAVPAAPAADSPPPAEGRRLLHRRIIHAEGFERGDGLWDLEARLTDTKTIDFPNHFRGGAIRAGEPLHGMILRVSVDINLTIREIDVQMPHTPYAVCADIRTHYQQALGLKIEAGFLRRINQLFKGVNGCAHVTELWRTIGTLAYQTLFPEFARRNIDRAAAGLAGACHVHATAERARHNIDAHIPRAPSK